MKESSRALGADLVRLEHPSRHLVPALAPGVATDSSKVDLPGQLAGVLPGLPINATANTLVNALKGGLSVSSNLATMFPFGIHLQSIYLALISFELLHVAKVLSLTKFGIDLSGTPEFACGLAQVDMVLSTNGAATVVVRTSHGTVKSQRRKYRGP